MTRVNGVSGQTDPVRCVRMCTQARWGVLGGRRLEAGCVGRGRGQGTRADPRQLGNTARGRWVCVGDESEARTGARAFADLKDKSSEIADGPGSGEGRGYRQSQVFLRDSVRWRERGR